MDDFACRIRARPHHGLTVRDIDDTRGTAAYLGLPHRTLEDLRYRGTGPAFVRVGRAVRYRRADVDAWLDSQTVSPAAS